MDKQNFCKIIGAGAVEPDSHRYNSGLLLVIKGKPYLVDVTPQNWTDFGGWLYHPQANFLITHGHGDHFNCEEPWRAIFDPDFANFGKNKSDKYPVHLYASRGLFDLFMSLNGINPQKKGKVLRKRIVHQKLNSHHHYLERTTDDRQLHFHILDLQRTKLISDLNVVAFDTNHNWSYPSYPPFHVHNRTCLGFIFNTPNKSYLYMPDFDIDKEKILEKNIIKATNDQPLNYFVVGVTNPDARRTDSSHSSVQAIYQLYQNLKTNGTISDQTKVVFTHLNPNWQWYDFTNPGFPEEKFILAENGTIL